MFSCVRALCVCVVLWTFLGLSHSQNGSSCKTRQGGVGKCTRREVCEPLIKAVGGNFYSPESIQILLDWRCNKGNLVCCPNDKLYSQPPPSIARHRNLRLLPQTDCGEYTEERVFGGNKTGVIEFPWMALISMDEGYTRDFKCGGSIINEHYILTAAHCVTGQGVRLVGIRVGEHDISTETDCEPATGFGRPYCAPPVQDFAIAKVIPHPAYVGLKPARNLELQHDIALIRIDGKINLQVDNALPICLPTYKAVQELNLTGMNLTVAGWGKTNMDQQGNRFFGSWSQPSPDLLKAHLPVISNKRCGQVYNGSLGDGISYKQMCAGGVKGVSSCGGDSGGPLILGTTYNGIIRAVQYGVVSGGFGACGSKDWPGVYTRVAYYMDWILDNIEP